MLGFMGSRFAIWTMGTTRVVPRMTRSSFGVGRHFDRAERRAFFAPYRRRSRARNFHRTMRSARRSSDLFDQADAAPTGRAGRHAGDAATHH